jgi:amidohydrolase
VTVAPGELGDAVGAVFDEMVDTRRDLHAHPELSADETRTTALVRSRLAERGLVEAGRPTPTGAVFDLAGGHPGRTVVLRADIDALPVHESVDVPFASSVDGLMHACGHDVHTAALLGVARVLSERADSLPGRYRFIFQPAEEGACGAQAMIDGGALADLAPDTRLVGFHVASVAPVGLVGVRDGIAMAEVHSFRVSLHGPGAHGGMPSEGGHVVLAAAQLVRALGDVVEDLSYESVPCVCSAGMVQAGTAPNVVPTSAVVHGTLRTFTDEQRTTALERLYELCGAVAEAEQVTVEVEVPEHASAVVNTPEVTSVVESVARDVVGPPNVLRLPPVSPSDDVSEMLKVLGGCYFIVGGGLADGSSGMHHCPTFTLDEESLRVGASVMADAAVSLAGKAGGRNGTDGQEDR